MVIVVMLLLRKRALMLTPGETVLTSSFNKHALLVMTSLLRNSDDVTSEK